MNRKLRMGIIGAGRIGAVHARTLKWRIPEADLRVIADNKPDSARFLAEELGIAKTTNDYRAVLDDPWIEAVLICSSTDTHSQLVIEAARARKHIFCEKPLDLGLARIGEMLAEVKKAGVKLQVGFNRRFDPDFKEIRERVKAGAIGTPNILRITSRDPAPPPLAFIKRSGGMFLDMSIHDFDMARCIMGDVEEVYVSAAVLVDEAIGAEGDVDTAVISLKFKSGALGTIDNCRRAVYGYDQRLEVLGSKGMLTNTNRTPHVVSIHHSQGSHQAPLLNFFMQRYTEAFAAEMAEFVRAVREEREPPVTGEDGFQAMVLAHAALRSVNERRPVRIEELLEETRRPAETLASC
jgi:myo-inositol 2-dehydrogenase/D-chiro-inositol 1-dehydrogenase